MLPVVVDGYCEHTNGKRNATEDEQKGRKQIHVWMVEMAKKENYDGGGAVDCAAHMGGE
jgi:hypothetical protein